MTTCPDQGMLARLLDSDLPPEGEEAVRAHLSSCERCRAAMETLTDGDGLRAWSADPRNLTRPDPTEPSLSRLIARLTAEPPAMEFPPLPGEGASGRPSCLAPPRRD